MHFFRKPDITNKHISHFFRHTILSMVVPFGREFAKVFGVLKFGELNNMNFSNNMPIEIFQFFCWNP